MAGKRSGKYKMKGCTGVTDNDRCAKIASAKKEETKAGRVSDDASLRAEGAFGRCDSEGSVRGVRGLY
jgi:hypothetical protein